MNHEFFTNLALASRYQGRAVATLVPPRTRRHLRVVYDELHAIALETLEAVLRPPAQQPPHEPEPTRIDIE